MRRAVAQLPATVGVAGCGVSALEDEDEKEIVHHASAKQNLDRVTVRLLPRLACIRASRMVFALRAARMIRLLCFIIVTPVVSYNLIQFKATTLCL